MTILLTEKQARTLMAVLINYKEPDWSDTHSVDIDREDLRNLKGLVKSQYAMHCGKH